MLYQPISLRSFLVLSSHLSQGLPSGLFSSGFPTITLYAPVLFPIIPTCFTYLILLDSVTHIIFGEECRPQSSSICSFLHPPVTSSVSDPNIFLNILFSNSLGSYSYNVTDQVSHPYKTTGKIKVLYMWIFIFLDSKLEGKWFCAKW